MAKSPEVKVAVFGRAGVGKSGKSTIVFLDLYKELNKTKTFLFGILFGPTKDAKFFIFYFFLHQRQRQ